jgi:hypothetical protein
MQRMNLAPFPQPESNDPDTVEAALHALRNAHDAQSATDACDAFLWAVGNNHAGTFHPVVLGVLPEIEQILASGNAWAQRAAMEALIDLGGTFVPEPGHETHGGTSVQDTLNAFIQSLRPRIAALAGSQDAHGASALDLLELLDDRAA